MKKYLLPIISLFSLVSLLGFSLPGSQELRINNNNIYGNNLDYSITGNFIVLNIASPSNYTSYVLTVYPSVTAGVEITLSSGEVLYQGGNPKRVVYDYSSNPDIILTHTESGVTRRYKTLFTNFTNPTLGTANAIVEPRVSSFNLYTSSLSGSVGSCQVKNLNIFCEFENTTAIGGNLALAAVVNNVVSTLTSSDFNIIRNGSSSTYYTPTTVNVNMPKTFTVTGTNGVSRKYNLYIDEMVSSGSSAKKITRIYDDTYSNESEVIQDQNNLYMRISTNGQYIAQINHSSYLNLTINGISISNSNSQYSYSITPSNLTIASGMNYPVIAKAQDGSIANYTLYVLAPLGTIVSDMTYYADFNNIDFAYDRKKVGNTYFIGVDSSTYETLSDYSATIYRSSQAKVYVDGELFTGQNLDWTQPHSVTIKSFDDKKENTFTIKVMQISTTSAQDNGVPFVPIVEVDNNPPVIYQAYIYSNPLDNGNYFAVLTGNEFKIEVPSNYNLENLNLYAYGSAGVQVGEYVGNNGGTLNLANPITLYAYNNQGLRKEYTLVVEKTLPPIPAYNPSTSADFFTRSTYMLAGNTYYYNYNLYPYFGNTYTVSGNNLLLPELDNSTDINDVRLAFFQFNSTAYNFSIPGFTFGTNDYVQFDLSTPKVVKVFAEAGNVAYYTITGFVPPLSSVVGINYYRNFAFHKVMQDADDATITHLFLNDGYSVSNAPIYYDINGKNAKIKFNGEFIPTSSSNRGFNASSPIVFTLIAENGSTVTSKVIVHPYDEADLDPVLPPSLSSDARVYYLSINNATVYYYNQPSNSNGYFANDVIYIRLDRNYTSKRFAADFGFFVNSNDVTVYVNDVLQFNGSSIQDFTEPVTFKIVAQNGTTKYYTVVVADPSAPFKLIANTLTGVSETLTKQTSAEVVLYPNPIVGGDELSVSTGLAVANAIEIYSLVGSLQKSIKPISNVSTINTYGLAKGVYLAKIKWADLSSKTIRFVID